MNFEIHTLFWKDSNPIFYEYHSKIMKKFNININYTNENVNNGKWMNHVMNRASNDIIGFIDIDCVVTNKKIIYDCLNYVDKNKSIIGISQVSNHISPFTHIFVGPGFFFINKNTWLSIGKPSFGQLKHKLKNIFKTKYDFAEGVCYAFEKKNIKYRALYPLYFDQPHPDYYIHNYGVYGIGTYYHGGIYHLYESRSNKNANIFKKKCELILNDQFTTENMISSIKI